MGNNTNKMIPIKGDVLQADMKSAGVSGHFLSKAIGMGETYVATAIRSGVIGESNIMKIADLFGKDPMRYVITKTETPEAPADSPDWQLIVSAVAENGVAIKQLHQDMLRLHDLIDSIAENVIQNKLVTYTSQINARIKSMQETSSDTASKATLDALKDIGSSVQSIRANSQRHYETQKTQIDKLTVEVKRKKADA